MYFNNLDELSIALINDTQGFSIAPERNCFQIIKELRQFYDLGECLKKISTPYRVRLLKKGFAQFWEHCDFKTLTKWEVAYVFDAPRPLPALNEIVSESDWRYVLKVYPQLGCQEAFEFFNDNDWEFLLSYQPELVKYWKC